MATYEGKWRCLRCSTVNLGRNLNCLSCGVKRDESVVFFLDDEAAALADEKFLKQANAGTDWICRYCDGNNRAAESRCSSCGSIRSEADKQLIEETGGIYDWSEEAQKAATFTGAQQNFQMPQTKNSFSISRLLKFGLLGLGIFGALFVALFAVLIYISTLAFPVNIEVTGLEWQRTIFLEEYKTVTETAWEGEVPKNARVRSSEKALHHTDKVADGTRQIPEEYSEQVSDGTESYVCGKINKKNGYFEDKYCTRTKYKTVTKTRNKTETIYKDVPVYKTRYTYLIDKWIAAEAKTTSGSDFNPRWEDVQVDNVRMREGSRTESYNLICKELNGENKLHRFELSPENWSKFQSGMQLHGKIDFFGRLISIEELPDGKW
jgi:hypothetical protein